MTRHRSIVRVCQYDLSMEEWRHRVVGAFPRDAKVRLLKPGGIHLIWAMDSAPSDLRMNPEVVESLFSLGFRLRDALPSRRRLARSHWYWLERDRKRP